MASIDFDFEFPKSTRKENLPNSKESTQRKNQRSSDRVDKALALQSNLGRKLQENLDIFIKNDRTPLKPRNNFEEDIEDTNNDKYYQHFLDELYNDEIKTKKKKKPKPNKMYLHVNINNIISGNNLDTNTKSNNIETEGQREKHKPRIRESIDVKSKQNTSQVIEKSNKTDNNKRYSNSPARDVKINNNNNNVKLKKYRNSCMIPVLEPTSNNLISIENRRGSVKNLPLNFGTIKNEKDVINIYKENENENGVFSKINKKKNCFFCCIPVKQ